MTDAQPPASPAAPLNAAEDKQWGSFAHFGGVLGPLPALIIFLVFRARGEITKRESTEALNWQITFAIGWIVLGIVGTIIRVIFYGAGLYFIGDLLSQLPLFWWILNAVLSILGGVKVQGGGSYRYPFAVRLIK